MEERKYICIDLKSFYASVECVERGLDPMTTNLVVADPTRTEKTICLAITPSMKALGIKNRCRVFQIPKGIDYIMATPRMQLYIDYAARIYEIYLSFISKDDIYVYSVDEAFMEVTKYLKLYNMTAKELGIRIMDEIYDKTGVRATCGVGTNMYLTKVALDITAKHSEDFVGELDEASYKRLLWDHKPLTDFWRFGPGIVNRLRDYGITTMRQITECDEEILYRQFGVDAELIIDHAYGIETVTMQDIKHYKPSSHSVGSGQVLSSDYSYEDAKLIVKEMMDLLCLDLVEKELVTESITLIIGYSNHTGAKPSNGTISLLTKTNSNRTILPKIEELYDRIIDRNLPVKRLNISCNNVVPLECIQYTFFDDIEKLDKDQKVQEAVIRLKKKFGKNAILKGMNLSEKGTTIERNSQIGGHRSGT